MTTIVASGLGEPISNLTIRTVDGGVVVEWDTANLSDTRLLNPTTGESFQTDIVVTVLHHIAEWVTLLFGTPDPGLTAQSGDGALPVGREAILLPACLL